MCVVTAMFGDGMVNLGVAVVATDFR